MIRAIAIIGTAALAVGVIIYSFFDCLRSDPRDIRGIKRGPWIAVILLLPVIGGILWLAFGRPQYAPASSNPTRGMGPDDDPNFLRQLEEKRRAEQADAELDEWERRHRADSDNATGTAQDPTNDQDIPPQETDSHTESDPDDHPGSPPDDDHPDDPQERP